MEIKELIKKLLDGDCEVYSDKDKNMKISYPQFKLIITINIDKYTIRIDGSDSGLLCFNINNITDVFVYTPNDTVCNFSLGYRLNDKMLGRIYIERS